MSIVRMKRLRLFAMEEDKAPLLAQLQKLGCVEIDQPEEKLKDPLWAPLVRADSAQIGETRALHDSLQAALKALSRQAPVKTSLFTPREAVTAEQLFSEETLGEARAAAQAIETQTAAIAALYAEKSRLQAQKQTLAPWLGLELDLASSGTRNTRFHLLTVPLSADVSTMQQELLEAAPLAELLVAGRDSELQYLLLIAHNEADHEAQNALKKFGTSRAALKGWQGTAAENTARLDSQLARDDEAMHAAEARIAQQAPHRLAMQVVLDRLEQDLARGEAIGRLLATERTFFLEGWVTEPQAPQLEELLKGYTCAFQLADPAPDEEPPVKLKSNKLTYPLNMVTEMYSLPAYDGIDPNPLILPFFTLFFGIMYADLGYGLVLMALAMLALKFCHFKGVMDQMMRLVFMCGITTAVMGFAFGGFFGDVLVVIYTQFLGVAPEAFPAWLQWFSSGPLINPMADPMKLMVFSLVLGAVHLVTGMAIHIYMEARDGHALEGILDIVPWWVLFGGIGLGAVKGAWWAAWLGVALLVLTQGRHKKGIFGKLIGGVASLYDVTSYLSDVLSYLRLMALVLATSVIASVVNTLGAMTGVVGFVIIFLVGHSFNMAVNIIGTYVHAARLQYLEYFGKFYKEGGRAFAPLKIETNYVDIIKEEK